MGRFKRGAFQLADELQLPLLPVTINGSYKVLPRARGFGFVTWHPLSMTIHSPVEMQGQGPEAEHAAMEKTFEIIQGKLVLD
jgi:1-acyl-sn-glycerol-3-phosphate acyltransferase